MEMTMATEALDLTRTAIIRIRLPHRMRVLMRALRIARARRALKLYRQLADRDERVLNDVGLYRRRDGRRTWLAEMVLSQNNARS
jgi:hypothetical protein